VHRHRECLGIQKAALPVEKFHLQLHGQATSTLVQEVKIMGTAPKEYSFMHDAGPSLMCLRPSGVACLILTPPGRFHDTNTSISND
jgi:hypothetical protein